MKKVYLIPTTGVHTIELANMITNSKPKSKGLNEDGTELYMDSFGEFDEEEGDIDDAV